MKLSSEGPEMGLTLSKLFDKNSMTVRRFVKEYKPIEVIEPFKPDVIQFADPQEFTKYYREHEDEFANMPGYRISQPRKSVKNGGDDSDRDPEIKLIKDYRHPVREVADGPVTGNEATKLLERNENALKERLEMLEKRIANIESYLSAGSAD